MLHRQEANLTVFLLVPLLSRPARDYPAICAGVTAQPAKLAGTPGSLGELEKATEVETVFFFYKWENRGAELSGPHEYLVTRVDSRRLSIPPMRSSPSPQLSLLPLCNSCPKEELVAQTDEHTHTPHLDFRLTQSEIFCEFISPGILEQQQQNSIYLSVSH